MAGEELASARAGHACTGGHASTSASSGIDWTSWAWGNTMAPFMFIAHWSAEDGMEWSEGAIVPYGPLELMPAAQVLNYGQSIFEGMKAHASAAGRLVLFRPIENARRFRDGAERMAMPPVPEGLFMRGVQAVTAANGKHVPPVDVGSLYLRPLLLGSGPLLGLCPAPSYTFCVYACPVGTRLKAGQLAPLHFAVEERWHRAAPRGVGGTKAAGNYTPCLLAQQAARKAGLHDVVFLDARSDQYLEEGAGCNVFAVHGTTLTTPPAEGSILPGITRASLLRLAGEQLGLTVREEPLSVVAAMQADEMFASGTMMVVQPLGKLSYQGTTRNYAVPYTAPYKGSEGDQQEQAVSEGAAQVEPCVGPITQQLFTLLTDIQTEKQPDPYGWVWAVCNAPSVAAPALLAVDQGKAAGAAISSISDAGPHDECSSSTASCGASDSSEQAMPSATAAPGGGLAPPHTTTAAAAAGVTGEVASVDPLSAALLAQQKVLSCLGNAPLAGLRGLRSNSSSMVNLVQLVHLNIAASVCDTPACALAAASTLKMRSVNNSSAALYSDPNLG